MLFSLHSSIAEVQATRDRAETAAYQEPSFRNSASRNGAQRALAHGTIYIA
jgi:hypothetical protein